MPGAPHLARFSRDVGYRKPSPQASNGLNNAVRVPYVRTSVRGPKTKFFKCFIYPERVSIVLTLCRRLLNRLPFFRRKMHLSRANVLFQMLHRRRTRNRQHHR
jgi:hypothetical protein